MSTAVQQETVVLTGGLVVPLAALRLAWSLEERGITLRVDSDGDGGLMAGPPRLLTDADRRAMREHRGSLLDIARYVEKITG